MKLIETHIHGGYGINFNTCSLEDFHIFSRKILKRGIVAFCPTLVGDRTDILNSGISLIKKAMESQNEDEAKILGVHLEGTFLNPEKSGIQDPKNFLAPTVENFKKVTEENIDIIRIVTLAPELDKDFKLSEFLEKNNIRAHAGHTLGRTLGKVSGTTHHFNAMEPLSHKYSNIALQGLLDSNIYSEIIGDSVHITDDMLKLFFKMKPKDRVLLVSDALPIAHSENDSVIFCGKTIYRGGKDENGTLAGSSMFLDEIARNLIKKGILTPEDIELMAYKNVLEHLNISI